MERRQDGAVTIRALRGCADSSFATSASDRRPGTDCQAGLSIACRTVIRRESTACSVSWLSAASEYGSTSIGARSGGAGNLWFEGQTALRGEESVPSHLTDGLEPATILPRERLAPPHRCCRDPVGFCRHRRRRPVALGAARWCRRQPGPVHRERRHAARRKTVVAGRCARAGTCRLLPARRWTSELRPCDPVSGHGRPSAPDPVL